MDRIWSFGIVCSSKGGEKVLAFSLLFCSSIQRFLFSLFSSKQYYFLYSRGHLIGPKGTFSGVHKWSSTSQEDFCNSGIQPRNALKELTDIRKGTLVSSDLKLTFDHLMYSMAFQSKLPAFESSQGACTLFRIYILVQILNVKLMWDFQRQINVGFKISK